MTTQDSIQQQPIATGGDSVVVHHTLTPAQVLRWLPRDATPAQQDSAIQAHFKPSEIRWSKRPDTLHLPGHDKGHNMLDVDIPQYYREGFFSKDTLFHPELPGGRYGVAGDPVPYTVRSDNTMTILLLFCFIFAVVTFSLVKSFIVRQSKVFFYPTHGETSEESETSTEFRYQMYLLFVTTLLLSLLYYFHTLYYVGDSFMLSSQYYLIAIYFGIFFVYFLLKFLLYSIVNKIFFGSKKNRQWLQIFLFLIAVEGVLLFPIAMMQAYSDLYVGKVEFYFFTALILVKLLTIYQCYNIFFRRNDVKFQIILYFCALEIVPMLLVWSALDFTTNILKINF